MPDHLSRTHDVLLCRNAKRVGYWRDAARDGYAMIEWELPDGRHVLVQVSPMNRIRVMSEQLAPPHCHDIEQVLMELSTC